MSVAPDGPDVEVEVEVEGVAPATGRSLSLCSSTSEVSSGTELSACVTSAGGGIW